MEVNRQKQRITSRGGSRSIVNHVFHLTNCETQTHPTSFEVYHKLHFNAEKQGWLNDDARIQYENIIRHKRGGGGEVNFRRYNYNDYHAPRARKRGNAKRVCQGENKKICMDGRRWTIA